MTKNRLKSGYNVIDQRQIQGDGEYGSERREQGKSRVKDRQRGKREVTPDDERPRARKDRVEGDGQRENRDTEMREGKGTERESRGRTEVRPVIPLQTRSVQQQYNSLLDQVVVN